MSQWYIWFVSVDSGMSQQVTCVDMVAFRPTTDTNSEDAFFEYFNLDFRGGIL